MHAFPKAHTLSHQGKAYKRGKQHKHTYHKPQFADPPQFFQLQLGKKQQGGKVGGTDQHQQNRYRFYREAGVACNAVRLCGKSCRRKSAHGMAYGVKHRHAENHIQNGANY